MTLSEEVGAYDVAPFRKRAWVERQLGDEVEEFRALLANPDMPPTALWRVLRRRGITVAEGTVHKWAAQARS